MPVSITITHEDPRGALCDLQTLAEGFEKQVPVVVSRATVDPAPASRPVADRQTFTVPEGHEAVRDAEGRATGETRPIEPKKGRGRPKKEAPAEVRTPPLSAAEAEAYRAPAAVPEEDPQDAADEAEESAAAASERFTHDNVRAALGSYVKKFGMAAAQEDGPGIIGYPKISDIPDDQEKLKAAVDAVTAALESNPKNRPAL